MSLEFKLTGDVLEVKETLPGIAGTRVKYWYYDLRTWMKSSNGKQGDIPDRIMDEAGIRWVKDYYLPLLPMADADLPCFLKKQAY